MAHMHQKAWLLNDVRRRGAYSAATLISKVGKRLNLEFCPVSYHRQEEIRLFDHSLVQLPLDKQMQYQHNNIDVNHSLVYTR
jgi:hypothetical protein